MKFFLQYQDAMALSFIHSDIIIKKELRSIAALFSFKPTEFLPMHSCQS